VIVDVRSLLTYVEPSGDGPSLLYLHGALEWAGYSEHFVSNLSRRHCVIQPERQGHGRTADRPGDLTYASMSEDTAALIQAMALERLDIVGFSDGAIVALELARTRPELAGRVVAIAPIVSVSGLTDEAKRWLKTVTPETWPGEGEERHRELSPDGPEHWPLFAQKVIDMLRREPEIPLAELGRIATPTLVVGGDHDMIRLEHLIDIHRAIKGSELCILPGTTHELTVEQPDLLADITLRFLGEKLNGAGVRPSTRHQ
jgi:pimeloyl-ACP methyl ester carboxylesterase